MALQYRAEQSEESIANAALLHDSGGGRQAQGTSLLQFADKGWWKQLDWHKPAGAYMHPQAGLGTARGPFIRHKLHV